MTELINRMALCLHLAGRVPWLGESSNLYRYPAGYVAADNPPVVAVRVPSNSKQMTRRVQPPFSLSLSFSSRIVGGFLVCGRYFGANRNHHSIAQEENGSYNSINKQEGAGPFVNNLSVLCASRTTALTAGAAIERQPPVENLPPISQRRTRKPCKLYLRFSFTLVDIPARSRRQACSDHARPCTRGPAQHSRAQGTRTGACRGEREFSHSDTRDGSGSWGGRSRRRRW